MFFDHIYNRKIETTKRNKIYSGQVNIFFLFQMHPQDELSRIKMRNRRYMNACVQENSLMNVPMFGGGGPYMRGMPMNAPMGPSSTIDYEMAQDELAVSD